MTAEDVDDLMAMLSRAYPVTMNFATVIINQGFQNERVTTQLLRSGRQLVGALCRLGEFCFVHLEDPADVATILPELARAKLVSIQGTSRIVIPLSERLAHQRVWQTRLMTLPRATFVSSAETQMVEPSQRHELAAINDMTNQIFGIDNQIDADRQWYGLEHGYLRQYVVRDCGRVVATGTWVNTHPLYGNMIGICTAVDQRKRGYGRAITERMTSDIIRYHKTPYLRYDNPVAGAMYKKMGFVERDSYAILYL